jgi:hypothetical protein
MNAKRMEESQGPGAGATGSVTKATGKGVNTVLVMGLGLPTMRHLKAPGQVLR